MNKITESRFEKTGEALVKSYFKGDCEVNLEDKKTLRNVACLATILADGTIEDNDFKKLFDYAKELEKKEKRPMVYSTYYTKRD